MRAIATAMVSGAWPSRWTIVSIADERALGAAGQDRIIPLIETALGLAFTAVSPASGGQGGTFFAQAWPTGCLPWCSTTWRAGHPAGARRRGVRD
jgi:hypothetical protein